MQSQINTVTFVVNSAAAAQTLPYGITAAQVLGASLVAGGATAFAATALTVVTGAPTSSEIQFTGTPTAPSATVTLSAAPAANGQLTVAYVAPGQVVAAQ